MGDILDERHLIHNSTKFEYYEIKPDLGTDLNDTRTYYIVSESLGRWEIPCLSYLDVEGQLVKADGTRYEKDAQEKYPDVTITNNFFPFLFNNIKYKIDTNEVEVLDTPGILTTVNSLLTYQRAFNGLDMGWALDTGTGSMNVNFVTVVQFADADVTPADIAAANYQNAVILIAARLRTTNIAINFTLAAGDLVCAGANVARGEIFDHFNNIIIGIKLNVAYGINIQRFIDTDIPAGNVTAAIIRDAIKLFITKFNNCINNQTPSDVNYGFEARKNLLFNNCSNIMDPNNAGKFKFRIPLDHLFNFCKFYRNGIYNARHELRFTRQSDDMAVFRSAITDAGKIQLSKIKWLMPRVKLNPELELRVKENILKPDVYIPVTFISKYLRKHTVNRAVRDFPITYTLPGINSVRYIVVLFQSRDLAVYPNVQTFNNSIFNNPNNARENMIDISSIRAKVGGESFYISDYTVNDLSTNYGSSFYNEFKRLRQDYLNDYRDTDMITYAEFINLYRLYCINVSCQTKAPYGTSADIELQVTFNSDIPEVGAAEINLYTVTYYDSEWQFKYDGQKQISSQISMK